MEGRGNMSYATITEKQAGVIFGAWKRGEIETTKDAIDCCARLKSVIDSIFAKDGKASEKFADFVKVYKAKFDDSIFAL